MNRRAMVYVAVLCASAAARAGVVIHDTTSTQGDTGEKVLYAQNGMLRTEQRDAHGQLTHFTIIRDGAIYQFNVSAHTYTKMDRETMQEITARIPPQFREMMQKMRGEQGGKTDDLLQDAGRTEHVAGYTCHVWTLAPGGQREEMCLVPFADLPGGDELNATMQQVARTVTAVMSASYLPVSSRDLTRLAQLKGSPVRTRDAYQESHLKSIERRSVAADLFQPPTGYERKAIGSSPGARK